MKGLLLKEFYMMKKYCKSYLVIVIAFMLISLYDKNNSFFMMYPIVLSCMIPVVLLSYDEKQKWNIYSQIFPYRRSQIVSVKYILTLLVVLSVCCIFGLIQLMQVISGAASGEEILYALPVMLFLGLTAPAVMLVFIFKLGAEKGRMIYYGVVFAFCALCGGATMSVPDKVTGIFSVRWLPYALALAGAVAFGVSWGASIMFYEKREL